MATNAASSVPTGAPAERRKFQLTNLDGNNNKYYLVEIWQLAGSDVFFRATYGRVGAAPQIDERTTTQRWVESKVREKLAKGYQEVTLHRPAPPPAPAQSAPGPQIDPKVQRLIEQIFSEARDRIASYLAVEVDALGKDQIERGRALLARAQAEYAAWQVGQTSAAGLQLARTVQEFYNAIPTQLPGRIDRDQVVRDFCNGLDEQEDRLNQLEAALATHTAQQSNPQVSLYDALGAEMELMPESAAENRRIRDYVERTCVHGYKVQIRDVFTVKVPDERRAFEHNQQGIRRRELLFHGTGSQNVRHILRSGLIVPRTPSHGRMFGHGVYFANKSTKSTNYCSVSRKSVPHFLFLAEVALGKPYVAPQAMTDLSAAPRGYDSVWGKAGKTGSWGARLQYDEFVVYSSAQQTLRYLVTFDR